MSGHRIEAGEGGLERVVVATPMAEAHIYRHGAHVTHFQPAGFAPVLWLSKASFFESGKPIRGGVPVCFPWFGPKADDPAAPAHGSVRTKKWDLLSVETLDNGSVRVSLATDAPPFMVTHTVTVGHALTMRLDVYNRSPTPATFEAALHTYLAVGDVREIGITGLKNAAYIDKVDAMKRKTQAEEMLMIAGETDRPYVNTDATVQVRDPRMRRVITVEKSGALSTVVWNPWAEKAKKMADFGDDEWTGMVCVETANVADNAVTVPAGKSHTMIATVSASAM